MSHIADLHNRGRVALHQTIDQARGAYFQLINKEQRAAEAAMVRARLTAMNVTCTVCGARVFTAKCHVCGTFPVPIPTEVLRPTSTCSTMPSSAGLSRASTNQRLTEERLERLEAMIRDEQQQQREVLAQISAVRSLLEKELLQQPAAAQPTPQLASTKAASKNKSVVIRAASAQSRPNTGKGQVSSKGYPTHNRLPAIA
jgi:hypothetical protein